MSRIFLIHGWGGSPDSDWFLWAKKELEQKGYKVIVPVMPDTENPKIQPWLQKLSEVVGSTRKDDIFIGHSIGTLATIRFLESLNEAQKVNKVILIAPWHSLTLDENEDPEIAKPWIEEFVDWERVKSKADKVIAVFSKDDPFVPFEENLKFFKDKLNPEIIIKDKMGHFNQSEIPFLLELI